MTVTATNRREELHLWDYLQVVLSRLPLALGIFAAIVALAALYTFTRVPLYRATSRIQIERQTVNLTGIEATESANSPGGDRLSDFMPTQLKLITARPVLEQALVHAGALNHPAFSDARDPVTALADMVSVVLVRGSRLVDVSVERPDPEDAAALANAVVQSFKEDSRRRRLGISSEGVTELGKTADALLEQLKESTAELHEFLAQHNIVSFEDSRRMVQDRMRGLNESLWRTEPIRLSYQARVEAVQQAMAEGRPVDSLPEVLEAPITTQLTMELIRLNLEYAEMRNRLGENHTQLKSLDLQRQALQSQIARIASSILESLNTQFVQAKKEAELLRAAIADQQTEVERFNLLAAEHAMLVRNRDTIDRNHAQIAQRIEEIRINQVGGQGEQVFTVFPAEAPPEPAWPSPLNNLIIAILGGGVCAIVVCFFIDYMDTAVKSVEEVDALTEGGLLGLLPKALEESHPPEFHVSREPLGAMAESFRIIRTALGFSIADGDPLRRLVVTSCLPSEGKTITAANLAQAYAAAGQSTLLIDADLRKPRLHKVFDLPNERGLSTLLSGQEAADGAAALIRPSGIEGLSVLPSGPIPPNPAELLGTPRFAKLLDALGTDYEMILLDSAPVNPVVDATLVGAAADGVVLVVRLQQTPHASLKHVQAKIEQAGIRNLGVIVNAVDSSGAGFFGYGAYRDTYRYGYGA